MKLIVASHNKGKINEFKALLEPLGYEILSASMLDIDMSGVVEDGLTFADNARIKTKFLSDITGMVVVADDSGLCIESLPDILGVHSARFMGEDTDYQIKNNEVLRLLKDKENRNAYFHSSISLYGPGVDEIFEGDVHGVIADAIHGEGGFGYDPIFVPNGYEQSFGTMDSDLKNKISHRAIALKQFIEYMKENS